MKKSPHRAQLTMAARTLRQQFKEGEMAGPGLSVSRPGVAVWGWPGVRATRPRALQRPLTGSLDLLRGFPEGFTVSPAARKAAILASISDT